jgi:hypothetical protein
MAVVLLVVLAALASATAVVAEELVSVEGGPATPAAFVEQCNDIGFLIDEQRSFVLRRPAPAAGALTVGYQLSGVLYPQGPPAQPGVHYQSLPGFVTFPPGVTEVTVEVVPLAVPKGKLVQLTMAIQGDQATIVFVSPPTPGPVECGYWFSADPWNDNQSVAVGQPLHALTVEELHAPFVNPASGRFRVVGGQLPPGVTLNADGSFAGAPLVAGTYRSTIEACRPEPPGTCITTELTVTVQGTFLDSIAAILTSAGSYLRQVLAGLFGLT